MLPYPLKLFIESFSRLPSLGPRAATRLAFHILKLPQDRKEKLLTALSHLMEADVCPHCFFIKEKDRPLCLICADATRDSQTVAIVEKETDLLSIEKSGAYRGQYLILGELAPTGVLEEEQKRRIENMKRNVTEGKTVIKEIIVAADLTPMGDVLHETLEKIFKDTNLTITRLGRGIPTGGEVEFADPETLRDAIRRRH